MEWIFDNIQVLLAIAGGIAYWLNQRRKAASQDEVPPPPETTFEDPELAERTRRIREEIQRKIQRRAQGQPPGPDLQEREEYQEAPPPLPREAPPPPVFSVPRTASRAEARRQAEILEEQASLQERLREAEAMRSASQRRTAFEQATVDQSAAARVAVQRGVLKDLRDPAELRRAFILKEVLGDPVALRR